MRVAAARPRVRARPPCSSGRDRILGDDHEAGHGAALLRLTGTAATLAPCSSTPGIDVGEARGARLVEVQLDAGGSLAEVEHHIAPGEIPAAVRAAMDRLRSGGTYTDAERAMHAGEMLLELSRTVNGLEVEARFSAPGELRSEGIQVRSEALPAAVREAVGARLPGQTVKKYEEIRDGSRTLVEYHVKLEAGGARHKLMLSPAGELLGHYLELEAELEVPAAD
jgi:hypothetical protein